MAIIGLVKQRGFTLIELMVVLVIIGFSIGIASLAYNPASDTKRLNRQGDQLYSRLLFAQDEALLSGRAIGFSAEQTGAANEWQYRWYRFEKNKWQPLADPLVPIDLPEEIQLAMLVEDKPLEDILDDRQAIEQDEEIQPVLVLYPGGEVTNFDLQLYLQKEGLRARKIDPSNKQVYRISIDENGELVATQAEAS